MTDLINIFEDGSWNVPGCHQLNRILSLDLYRVNGGFYPRLTDDCTLDKVQFPLMVAYASSGVTGSCAVARAVAINLDYPNNGEQEQTLPACCQVPTLSALLC